MALEFKNIDVQDDGTYDAPVFSDVAGCHMRYNQTTYELQDVEALDFKTTTSAYDELINMTLDANGDSIGQQWSMHPPLPSADPTMTADDLEIAIAQTVSEQTELYC